MSALTAGFFGKIPSRGDFVRHGLPADAVAALDDWCAAVLPGSHERLGEQWSPAWMEAPIWRFRLAPGTCGTAALAGVWFPSTDRAGRLFPLIVALAGSALDGTGTALAHAERAGLAAIERDLAPADLAGLLAVTDPDRSPLAAEPGEWWTDGSPRVAPTRRRFGSMPDIAAFTAMLTD